MIPFETSPSICTQCHRMFSLVLVPRTTERFKHNARAVNIQQLYNRPASVDTSGRRRCRLTLWRRGRGWSWPAGGAVELTSQAELWLGVEEEGKSVFILSRHNWKSALALEVLSLKVPRCIKFTSQVFSNHRMCLSVKFHRWILSTCPTTQNSSAKKHISTSQYQICKCNAKSLLVGRL